MTTYRWKPGVVAKVDAQIAGAELERLKTWHNGALDPEHVVEASRDPDAPLHEAFEWDDKTAADAYRVNQAGYLIRSIEIAHVAAPEADPAYIRAFVSVERGKERSYTGTFDALADPDLRKQVVAAAWRELESWRQRHAELIEFARVFTVIDQARDHE